MLARISSAELTEWMAFSNMEPFGNGVPYLGDAIVASTIANVNRKKGAKAHKVQDFMPEFETKQQTTGEMKAIAQMYTAAFGNKDE